MQIRIGLDEETCRLAVPPPPDAGALADAGADAGPATDAGPPTCVDFPRYCESWVGIRVLHEDGEPVAEKCEPLSGADQQGNLCDIGSIDVSLGEIPPRRMIVEVSVWDADAATITTAPDGSMVVQHCPSIEYDTRGAPKLTPDSPAPAFARRDWFDFGSGAKEAPIELVCNDPKQLSDEMCLPVIAEAEILDYVTLLGILFDEAQNEIEVTMGRPRQDKDGNWEIEGDIPMRLSDTVAGLGPIFKSDDLQPRFEPMDDACVLVRRKDEAQPATMVRCIVVENDGDFYIDGFTLREATLRQLLSAVGLAGVPNQGIVIGRITQENGLTPVAGARVVIQHPNATDALIFYLNDDLTAANLTSTGAQGYFIVQNLPFNAYWAATGPDGLTTDRTIVRAGELSRRVTLMKLVLYPPAE